MTCDHKFIDSKRCLKCGWVSDAKDEPVRKQRRRDGADAIAERLFDMVRDAKDDQEVTDAIAAELRKAAQGPRKWGILR